MADESRTERRPEERLPKDLAQVEAALSGLAPRPARLSAARLMYLAGQQSAARTGGPAPWLWPSIAALASLAAVAFAALWGTTPTSRVVERVVYVERPAPQQPERREAAAQESRSVAFEYGEPSPAEIAPEIPQPVYLQARNLALSRGVESLQEIGASAGQADVRPATYRELQNRILEGEAGPRRPNAAGDLFTWPSLLLPGGGR